MVLPGAEGAPASECLTLDPHRLIWQVPAAESFTSSFRLLGCRSRGLASAFQSTQLLSSLPAQENLDLKNHTTRTTRTVLAAALALASATTTHAAILTSGRVNPSYPGSGDWTVTTLTVGRNNDGTVTVNGNTTPNTGRILTSDNALLGENGGGGTVNIQGAGSVWNNTNQIIVGSDGAFISALNVTQGGVVNSGSGLLGDGLNVSNIVTVSGAGSQWNMTGNLQFGEQSTLTIEDGGLVSNVDAFLGDGLNNSVIVRGIGSQWNNSGTLEIDSNELTIEQGGVVNSVDGRVSTDIATGPSTVTITGAGSLWNLTGQLTVGERNDTTFTISDGGRVNSVGGVVNNNNSTTITGAGSRWENTGTLTIGNVFNNADIGVVIADGGVVNNLDARITDEGSRDITDNMVTVTGAGSQWNTNGLLEIGYRNDRGGATATLNIEDGGLVTSTNAALGVQAGVSGFVTVTGTGSRWENSGDLTVGIDDAGTLTIETGGVVAIGGTTAIGDQGIINLTGGRLEFGTMSNDDFAQINGVTGSLAGSLEEGLTGFIDAGRLSTAQMQTLSGQGNIYADFSNISVNVDVTEVMYGGNSGVLFGDGFSDFGLTNNADGTVEVITGERQRFDGDGTNNGAFDLFGGQLRFTGNLSNDGEVNTVNGQLLVDGTFTNESGGTVQGRGIIDAAGGTTNHGTMSFSGSQTDIFGDFNNEAGGTFLTAGGGTSTFYGNVVHNGTEIRTAEGSYTVFLGDYSGAGAFTGEGTVQFEGTVNIGNSPAVVSAEGGVFFTDTSTAVIEIEGLLDGEFDKFLIGGDLDIEGDLDVQLINFFELGLNQSFLFADVEGNRTGIFTGLGEGALVGNYNSVDLFITYAAGDGNDLALYTVPEPNTAACLALGALLLAARRRRRAA